MLLCGVETQPLRHPTQPQRPGFARRRAHTPIRRCCRLNFSGEIPVWLLKRRVKWLCDTNPRSRAIRASETVLCRNIARDIPMRRLLVKRPRLMPAEC